MKDIDKKIDRIEKRVQALRRAIADYKVLVDYLRALSQKQKQDKEGQ